jgi:hypothetical protein
MHPMDQISDLVVGSIWLLLTNSGAVKRRVLVTYEPVGPCFAAAKLMWYGLKSATSARPSSDMRMFSYKKSHQHALNFAATSMYEPL